MPRRTLLLLDASVLIDYVHVDRSVLDLTVRHLGDVLVPEPILDEVEDLSREDCEALGIQIVTATTEQLTEAASLGRKGPLSFNDRVLVLIARDQRLVCVTNDRALRTACRREKLEVRWSLRLMLDLVAMKVLAADDAERIARAIAEENRYITPAVVSEFCRKLGR